MKKYLKFMICILSLLSGCSTNSQNNISLDCTENPAAETTVKFTTAESEISTQPQSVFEGSIEKDIENAPEIKTAVIERDWQDYFHGINGCAIIYDQSKNEYRVYNQTLSEKRSSPCSTFKIVSTLIGLKSSTLKSVNTVMRWNGNIYSFEEWNQDLTLKQAFQLSCVWYFKQVTELAGKDTVQNTLNELSYGNCDISQWEGSRASSYFPELNGFWLESSLLISPREQVDVMTKIFSRQTDAYKGATLRDATLRDIMLVENTGGDTKIYGKTGSGYVNNLCVDAWFVGFAENGENGYYFAIRLDDPSNKDASSRVAKEIAINIVNTYTGSNAPTASTEEPEYVPSTFDLTKDYIMHEQGDKPETDRLKWSESFLNQVNFQVAYQDYLGVGGEIEDYVSFAKYLTFNTPVQYNWHELFEEEYYTSYDAKIKRYEHLQDDLYQVYVEIDGKEIPYVVVSARTGCFYE